MFLDIKKVTLEVEMTDRVEEGGRKVESEWKSKRDSEHPVFLRINLLDTKKV